jgi:hypothetical protein
MILSAREYCEKGNATKFIVFDIQEDEFWPEVRLLRGFDDLR